MSKALWMVPLLLVVVLLASFIFDAFSRLWMTQQVSAIEMPLNGGSDHLVVVLPGAFSSAYYQFEPIAAEMKSSATMLYVEQFATVYRHEKFDTQVGTYVADSLMRNTPRSVTFIGTSMGAGRSWQLAQNLRKAGLLRDITTNFVAIDGVGSADDLVAPGPFGAKYVSRLPFGWFWNRIPVAKVAIQPSDTPPLLEWAEHARRGLDMARRTPTASWAGQLRAMGATHVSPGSLEWMNSATYVDSVRDKSVVKRDKSLVTWQKAAGSTDFIVKKVDANHTDYEANPQEYAEIIDEVIG